MRFIKFPAFCNQKVSTCLHNFTNMLRMENLKYRKLLSLWGWSGDDTYFLDGHRLETLQMRDNVTEATLKMFGRTHHVTTAVYHLGLDANFTGWLLLETAGTGIHYPELLRRECEMRCFTSKIQALDTKVREVQLIQIKSLSVKLQCIMETVSNSPFHSRVKRCPRWPHANTTRHELAHVQYITYIWNHPEKSIIPMVTACTESGENTNTVVVWIPGISKGIVT